MKTDLYKQTGNSPTRLVDSILSHMLTYKNTAIKKDDRIESAKAAKVLIEYIIVMYDTSEEQVLVTGLTKINESLTICIMKQNELRNIDDEIGFIRVLKSIVV